MNEAVSSKRQEEGAESQPPAATTASNQEAAAKVQVEAPLNPEDQEHEKDK